MKTSRMNALPRWNAVVVAAMLGLAFALPASAQWKWRDKGGQTQYSDLPPPPGTPEKDILQRPAAGSRQVTAPAAPASAASGAQLLTPKAVEPELEAKRKKGEQDAAGKAKAEEAKAAAVKADNCNRAKAQMRALDTGMRMARVDDKGERIVLDDTARAAETESTRAAIASECK